MEAPVMFLRGQKKTGKAPVAPWSGSKFESEYEQQVKNSEYNGVYHANQVINLRN